MVGSSSVYGRILSENRSCVSIAREMEIESREARLIEGCRMNTRWQWPLRSASLPPSNAVIWIVVHLNAAIL